MCHSGLCHSGQTAEAQGHTQKHRSSCVASYLDFGDISCRSRYPDSSLVWLPLPARPHYGLPCAGAATAHVCGATSGFTCVTACIFVVRNSRPSITRTPLLHAAKAYGQSLGRDFNPPACCCYCERLAPIYYLLLFKLSSHLFT